ncbi:MAG: Ig-like domain-containing protein [Longimicrobiales bacterium]
MNRSNWACRAACLLLTAIVFSACDQEPTDTTDRTVVVGRLSLPGDSFTVAVGRTVFLEATAVDQRGALLTRLPNGESLQWTSSDNTIARVEDGLVTGVRAGRSIITVRGGGQLAAARVGVIAQ